MCVRGLAKDRGIRLGGGFKQGERWHYRINGG